MRELAVREVARGVWVATARTYTTTTTIVAGSDGGCLLVDPAVSVADLAALAGLARRARPAARRRLVHPPALGSPALVRGTWRRAAVRDAACRGGGGARGGGPDRGGDGQRTRPRPDAVRPDHRAARPGDRLAGAARRRARARRARPGPRCRFLPDTGVLIAGDMCSDIEIPLPDLDTANPFGSTGKASACWPRRTPRSLCPVRPRGGRARVPPPGRRRPRLPQRGRDGYRHHRPAAHRGVAAHRARSRPRPGRAAR